MENDKKYDVVGMSNPLLDLIIAISDEDLAQTGLTKGEMHLVNEHESRDLYLSLREYPTTIAAGGSAANTLAGVSILGGRTALMGTIGEDENGKVYEERTTRDGVTSRLATHGQAATGNAITLITPDGERTFATHLGAALQFGEEQVREEDILASAILHIEGYYLEDAKQKGAALHAMKIAKANGIKVSVDLADPALVGRIREALQELLPEYVDIIFANELEAEAFTGKSGEEALHDLATMCEVAVVKLGERGSLIKAEGTVHTIAKHPADMKNTNGAGDMYAAGILYGLTHGLSYEQAGDLASFAAACVVASEGARLDDDLKETLKEYSMKHINA